MCEFRICLYPWARFLLIFHLVYLQTPTAFSKGLSIPDVTSRHSPPACLTDPSWGVHKFIEVNNITMHYVEKGDSSKSLMLLINGYPEFWYSWRYQLRDLCDDYWIIALDLPGVGDSDKPTSKSIYKLDNLVEITRELVRTLGRRKFILVGHGTGAWVGWRYLDLHMDTIDKYIMMGSASMPIVWKDMFTDPRQFLGSLDMLLLQVPEAPELVLKSFHLGLWKFMQGDNKIKRNTITDEDIEAFKYTYGKPGAITGSLHIYRENVPPPESKVPQRDKTLDAPGLVLFGEYDIFTIRKAVTQLKEVYFNLEYQEVEDTSYFLQQDNPSAVNRIMREFLSQRN